MIEIDNLKKALEADSWCNECGQEHLRPAIEQLIKALTEQPTQEHVAWLSTNSKANEVIKTHQWQGLSDYEIKLVITTALDINVIDITKEEIVVAYAIEAKLREKNNG